MSAPPVKDALLSIQSYDPIYQAKIRSWYPYLESAKKEAYEAWKQMEQIFYEPPIFVNQGVYMLQREKIISNWNKAWQKWQQMFNDFSLEPSAPPAPQDPIDQNPKSYP
jgi:hypothetical protein